MRKKSLGKYFKLAVLTVAISSLFLVGCGKSNKNENVGNDTSKNQDVNDNSSEDKEGTNGDLPVATIVVKGMGTIKAELYPEIAPKTVDNFIELANKGFYDGLTFHRIIKDFMIQGGDPNGDGTGGPGYAIKGEFTSNGVENNLKHTEGVLSMARSSAPDSAGSQFFIMTEAAEHLDGQYAAFGKVIEGMDVVDKIESVTLSGEKPKEKVEIQSIKVDTKGKTYNEVEKVKE